ncbi:hypothetical protein NKG05_26430 [Oerskovia sp. M15]
MHLLLAVAEPLDLAGGRLLAGDACDLIAEIWTGASAWDVDRCVLNPGPTGSSGPWPGTPWSRS